MIYGIASIIRILTLSFSVGLAFSAYAYAETNCGAPSGGAAGWEIAGPGDVGVDPNLLCSLVQHGADLKENNVHAILVARHGKLIFEQYYSGSDEKWGQQLGDVTFGPTVPHDLRSISKSVVSLVLGIGIDKGWVHDIDQPVFALLPNYADLRSPEKDRVRLRDLLTMSSGLTWNEHLPYGNPENSETRMDRAADPCRFVLEQPVQHSPGSVWNYSGGSAALIACVLHQATGKTIDQLAEENLFKPLGISNAEWAPYPKIGAPVAASGLRLLPGDTLKIGQLVLNKGMWHGQQIVPAAWIQQATTPQINGPGSYFYGFQFWLGRSLVNQRQVDWAAGFGYGGQHLVIIPSLDMVVLIHAGLYGNPAADGIGDAILNRFILPAAAP
ncbi:serine hydrolase [Agrobacterium rhizogenes]|nr:serine hydrolase [Rhizobium rhizogenes]